MLTIVLPSSLTSSASKGPLISTLPQSLVIEESRVEIYGGAKINGSAEFNNQSSLVFGKNADSEFIINNRLNCKSTKAVIQGKFDVIGQVDLYDIELSDNTSFKTHGHHFNVEKDVSQSTSRSDFSVTTDAGEVNFGQIVYVSNLTIKTTSPIYIGGQVEAVNLTSSSPLTTFAGDTLFKGQIQSKSIASLGNGKKVQINHGGKIAGDAKLANTSTFILGQSDDDVLELTGAFDRSNGETIAQGTIRSHAAAIDFEELTLSGKLNVLSVGNDGDGSAITFHSNVNGAYPLSVNAGNSKVYINKSFGDQIALAGLSIYANELNSKADIILDGGSGEFYTNLYLANNMRIDDYGKTGLFFYGKVSGDYDLDAYSKTLIVVKKDMGASTPLNSLNLTAKRIDVWGSIAANSGSIIFDGDVELCDNVKLVNCGTAGISFNGKVDGDYYLEIKVNDHNGKVSFNDDVGGYQPIRHLVLATQAPLVFNKKLDLDHFETTAPNATFYNDVIVSGHFNVRNVLFDGARQNVNLMGGGEILGNATFNNKGDLCLGHDDQTEFAFGGIVSRINGPTYARGVLNTKGTTADFNALHAIGDLKIISLNENGTNFNFNGTFDGGHHISIATEMGSVFFYDYVGNHHPLTSLDVTAKNISMQRQIAVREGRVNLNANLTLLNHAAIKNYDGEGICVAGNINGEWDIALTTDADIELKGSIGQEYSVNHLIIETSNKVDFDHKVSVYNLKSTSPLLTFSKDVEIKKQINAKNVLMSANEANFTLLGGGHLKGDLELLNKKGITVIGESHYSSLTTDGQILIATENTYAQGFIQTVSEPFSIEKLSLNGPLKVSSSANKTSGSAIRFNQGVEGNQQFDVDAGLSSIAFVGPLGQKARLSALNVKGSRISLSGNVAVGEGSAIFDGNVELKNDIEVSDLGAGSISFLGKLNGGHELLLNNQHEMGRVCFAKAVGNEEPLKVLNIQTLNSVEFPVQVDVVAMTTTAPNLIFADEALVHKQINAHNVLTKGKYRSVRILGGGNFSGMTTFSNSGSLVLGNSENSIFNFSGPLHVPDCVLITQGQFNMSGSVVLKELTLKGNTSMKTTGNDFKVEGAIEQLGNKADLSVNIGSGQATFGNRVAINNLNLTTTESIQFHHNIDVAGFETTAPHVLFASNTKIAGEIVANSLTTIGTNNKVNFLGGGQIKGNTVLKNGSGICLGGNEQAVITFYGPLDTTASLLETQGTIETVDKTIDLGNMSVVGNTTIRSNSKESLGKDIYFLGIVNGPKQLRANAGKAKISFENNIGEKTALESLQATASKIEVDCDVNSQDGNVVFAGNVVFTNTSNLTAHGVGNIIFQGTVNVDDNAAGPVDLFLDATGKVEFQKDVGDSKAFNEVVVTRAGEIVCRSPLKSNIVTQTRSRPLQKIEAKKEESVKAPSQSQIENVEARKEEDQSQETVIEEV